MFLFNSWKPTFVNYLKYPDENSRSFDKHLVVIHKQKTSWISTRKQIFLSNIINYKCKHNSELLRSLSCIFMLSIIQIFVSKFLWLIYKWIKHKFSDIFHMQLLKWMYVFMVMNSPSFVHKGYRFVQKVYSCTNNKKYLWKLWKLKLAEVNFNLWWTKWITRDPNITSLAINFPKHLIQIHVPCFPSF